jgi:hypothetical protein
MSSEILPTLRVLARRDDAAYELRALGTGYNHKQVTAGYFTRATLAAAASVARVK